MEASRKHATDFLANWNMTLEDLVGCVRPLAPTETLMLVGSIVEGLADPLSDIDLIVIGDSNLGHNVVIHAPECEESVTRLPTGQEVNFEYWNTNDLEQFIERLNFSFDVINEPSKLDKIFKFSEREIILLHRLRVGVVLDNPEVAEHWRQRLRLESLPDYLIIQNLGHHYGYREDAIARVRYGDRLSAFNVLRITMDTLAGAMLASIGVTNIYPKWRTRLLEQNKAALGAEEVDQLLAYLFPDIKADPSDMVSEALAFSDNAISEIVGRRLHLIPALLGFDDQVSFVRRFDELPS
jgi:predicted nucleotidyltransferase